MIMANWITDF